MPFQVGSIALHDDGQHIGSAKRDVVDGVAGLGSGGQVLAPGPDLELTRDGSENIEIVERTSGNIVFRWTRIGVNDFECRINCGGVACIMQNDSMKDVVNGIAALNAAGEILAPGGNFFLTRSGVNDIGFGERTSGEYAIKIHRTAANDYITSLKVATAWQELQHAALKDVVNGIAGLDASARVLPAQMGDISLTVVLFQANAASGTATNPSWANDNNLAQSADFDAVNEYIEVDFSVPHMVTEFRHYGDAVNTGDGRYKIQHYINGRWIDNTLNIPVRTTADWSGWVSLTTQIYTSRIRLVCTTVDSFGTCMLPEIEMR